MDFHPDLGYEDNGVDLTDANLYKSAKLPFGQAKFLPPIAYQSKIFSGLEDEKLWTRNWIAIGSTLEIPNSGDLLPYTVGNHGIHVQKEDDGTLIGRFNKAQHGGCRAVPQQCQTGKKTKCSFTSCGYSRDRHVIRVEEIGENTPTMHQYLGLIPERLLPIKVETLGSLIFINVDQESNDLNFSINMITNFLLSIEVDNLELKYSEWFECESNWKFAGRAFFEDIHLNNELSIEHDQNENHFSVENLSSSELGLNLDKEKHDLKLFWMFPNLILISHQTFTISVVIQPTSMHECTLRTAIYKNNKSKEGEELNDIKTNLHDYLQSIIIKANAVQTQTDQLTAPGAPEITNDMIPLETNIAGYVFNRFITKQIGTEYNYYWNTPLYSNTIIR